MTKTRRDISDYTPEAYRFEEWLRLAKGESLSSMQDADQLIERLEEWLSSIDCFGSQQGRFARALLSNLMSRSMIPTKKAKEIQIIRDFLVDRSRRRWLKTEERHLARMYSDPKVARKVSVGYISRELGRSKGAVWAKARKLGLKRPSGAMTDTEWKRMRKA